MRLTHGDIVTLIFSLGVMLILSRLLGELARRFKFPLVVGEILTGIVIGKTILGNVNPEWMQQLFPSTGNVPVALNGITSLAAIMMLFVAGMEVELSLLMKQGKKALFTSIGALIVPISAGLLLGFYYFDLFGVQNVSKRIFSLFLGTALSISALPVIARILLDLGLFKTQIGSIVIASAMLNDLIGWLIFSVILGLIQEHREASLELWQTITLTFAFTLIILTGAKYIIDKSLPWFERRFAWPGGVLSVAFGLCFMGAAFTEYIGIHAIFGAFIMGLAFGDSVHLKKQAREIIHQFVTSIFAPLFFVSIGLRLDFVKDFDLFITLLIVGVAIISKLIGATAGAWIAGLPFKHSLAVGFGMNAHGAMEIILATFALEAKVINEKIFVALVIMAIITSMFSGPLMQIFCRDVVRDQEPHITELNDAF